MLISNTNLNLKMLFKAMKESFKKSQAVTFKLYEAPQFNSIKILSLLQIIILLNKDSSNHVNRYFMPPLSN